MIFYYRSYNNFTLNYFTALLISLHHSSSIGPGQPRDEVLEADWEVGRYFITFSINVMANLTRLHPLNSTPSN